MIVVPSVRHQRSSSRHVYFQNISSSSKLHVYLFFAVENKKTTALLFSKNILSNILFSRAVFKSLELDIYSLTMVDFTYLHMLSWLVLRTSFYITLFLDRWKLFRLHQTWASWNLWTNYPCKFISVWMTILVSLFMRYINKKYPWRLHVHSHFPLQKFRSLHIIVIIITIMIIMIIMMTM